jgi:tape measure domain-containing protein
MKLYEYIWRFKDQASEKMDRIAKASRGATQKLDKFNDELDDGTRKSNRFGAAMGSVGRVLGGLAIGAALFTAARASAKLGIEMEQTRVSFTTFLGSAEKANETIKELNQFSNVTPFDNAQVLRAGKGLLAFGVEQKKLIPTLKKIGDISAGTGKDFNELATIYGKARVAGTLYAEDINQLVEAGVPIMGEFAKALGTTEDQVKKLASEGKLKFKDLEKAFTNLTSEGGMFFNLMENQSQTLGGKISTLQGKFQLLGASIGENLIAPLLSPLVEAGIDVLDTLIDRTGKLTSEYEQQKSKTVQLNNSIKPLLDRYDKLSSLSDLNKKQQDELTKLTEDISKKVPGAISKWDEYGRVLGLSTDKAREFIRTQKELFLSKNQNLIDERLKELNSVNQRIKFIDEGLKSAKDNLSDEAITKNLDSLKKAQSERTELEAALAKLRSDKNLALTNFSALESDVDKLNNEAAADDGKVSKGIDEISGGGKKSVNVTVNLGSLIQEQNIEMNNLQEGLEDIEKQVTEALLRVINSANYSAAQ